MSKALLIVVMVLFTGVQAVLAVTAGDECVDLAKNSGQIANVDMAKIRTTWLGWYNDARAKNGLKAYQYTAVLDKTALEWSNVSLKKGTIDHKRPGQKKYYDYKLIGEWFKKQGVSFDDAGRSDFVENIGWDYYKCSKADCTDDLIKSIRHTFDFFMKEKGKKYRPHYESIMSKNYRVIGLGIAVDAKKSRYYLTVHYAGKATSTVSTGEQKCKIMKSTTQELKTVDDHKF